MSGCSLDRKENRGGLFVSIMIFSRAFHQEVETHIE